MQRDEMRGAGGIRRWEAHGQPPGERALREPRAGEDGVDLIAYGGDHPVGPNVQAHGVAGAVRLKPTGPHTSQGAGR